MALFTRENAREFSLRGNAVRWSRHRLSLLPPQPPENSTAIPDNSYVSQRLLRVRTQLDRIDAMILTECDPQKLDRLAAAQERLSRQEHDLAGRPHAGNLRPTAPRRGPTHDSGPGICADAPTQP